MIRTRLDSGVCRIGGLRIKIRLANSVFRIGGLKNKTRLACTVDKSRRYQSRLVIRTRLASEVFRIGGLVNGTWLANGAFRNYKEPLFVRPMIKTRLASGVYSLQDRQTWEQDQARLHQLQEQEVLGQEWD